MHAYPECDPPTLVVTLRHREGLLAGEPYRVTELRAFGDPDLERIADLGLFGITDKETVGLNVALMNFDRTPTQGKASAAAKVRASINAYRKAVDANNMVALLDTAPFSTRVELRATMYSALARIERALAPIA